jgi:hypothetical protein
MTRAAFSATVAARKLPGTGPVIRGVQSGADLGARRQPRRHTIAGRPRQHVPDDQHQRQQSDQAGWRLWTYGSGG